MTQVVFVVIALVVFGPCFLAWPQTAAMKKEIEAEIAQSRGLTRAYWLAVQFMQ